jgi:hypothetical protein
MNFSFLRLRKRSGGTRSEPRPQHGTTRMIAWPARWHGHLQSLRKTIVRLPLGGVYHFRRPRRVYAGQATDATLPGREPVSQRHRPDTMKMFWVVGGLGSILKYFLG